MRTDKKIIEAQLSAIEIMKAEFLKFIYIQGDPSPSDLQSRHKRIKEAFRECQDSMDSYWVNWLFCELEQRAVEELRKVTLLAQTTDPDALKDKHFNDLPQQLVDNVKILARHYQDTGMSKKGNAAKIDQKKQIENEVIRRAKWFLENPEPELKGKSYSSLTLSESIKKYWSGRWRSDLSGKTLRKKEPWEITLDPDGRSIVTIQKIIKSAIRSGELPKSLSQRGRPKNNK
ncbi:MAG: hypothetical protein ACXWUD_05580 [Methylosarcina sp.]